MQSTTPNSMSYQDYITEQLNPIWQQRECGFFKASKKTKLYYTKLTSPSHQKAVVLVNGRVESCEKYLELSVELFQQGFDVYSYDHRGQGLSPRLLDDKQKGYVEFFDDYVDDLELFIKLVTKRHYDNLYLLAHSMGGAIATRYLQRSPKSEFSAVALSAPMYGLPLPAYLRPISILYTQLSSALQTKPLYAPGYGPYKEKEFENNPLTHSKARFNWFQSLYREKEELQLGGPTMRWVWQSLLAMKQCYLMARHLPSNLLLLQAEEDTIVDNQAQNRLIARAQIAGQACQLYQMKGARHEILFEEDSTRRHAIEKIIRHFNENPSS
jgi:lysophospholipase